MLSTPNWVTAQINYYQQFDADHSLATPGEGYGGWKKGQVELDLARVGLVVMHAWDAGTPEAYPGWHRSVEYFARAHAICQQVMPRLLGDARSRGLSVFHVVGGGNYHQRCPGYQQAVRLVEQNRAGPAADPGWITADEHVRRLHAFRSRHGFVGEHNAADVRRGFERLDFPAPVRPADDEGVAENADQLLALCQQAGVTHLVYTGFAINWCLLMSPGGMIDMSRRGLMCSAIREAVTAVENRETARRELNKQEALWRVSVGFGFVFGLDDFLQALTQPPRPAAADVASVATGTGPARD